MEDKARDEEVESGGAPAGGGGGEDTGGDEGGLFAADIPSDGNLLDGNSIVADSHFKEADESIDDEDEDEDDDFVPLSIDDEEGPARVEKMIRNIWNEPIKQSRKSHRGPASVHSPDFASITSVGSKTRPRDSMNQPYDDSFFKNPFGESILKDMGTNLGSKPRLNSSMLSMLNKLPTVIVTPSRDILTEDLEQDLDIELIDPADSES